MLIALHKNARTTPAIRAEMAASSESAAVLANEHMQMLDNNPERVLSYFQDPRVHYAA